MRRKVLIGVGLAVSLVGPMLPIIPPFWVTLLDYVGIASVVAIGLVFLTGVGGMTSFGQAAFVGIGAYTTALMTTAWGISPWLSLFGALAFTGFAAVILGAVTVRLSGHYLPLGTIAWGISIFYVLGNTAELGAHDGINNVPPLAIQSLSLISARQYYLIVWIAVVGATVATLNVIDSRFGRAVRTLCQSEQAAGAFGIDTSRAKLAVFVYAALLAGLSGWLYAHFQRSVSPGAFDPNASIEYLLIAVAGGTGHVFGGIIGAAVVVLLKNALQDFVTVFGIVGRYEGFAFGILLIAILQFAPEGLWASIRRLILIDSHKPIWPVPSELAERRQPDRGTSLLKSEGLHKQFGGLVALNKVSFHLSAGEIVGLIGPNGAGKSTLFNLLTGLDAATAGEVHFLGHRIDQLSARKISALGIARTFQHVKLATEMSLLENTAVGAHARCHAGFIRAMIRANRLEERRVFYGAARVLEEAGLKHVLHSPAGSLAFGQLRIAEIARAICMDPIVLLLDEPAAGLRHLEKQALADLLRRIRSGGKTILIVEHDMDFVMSLVDRLIVLDFGQKIAEGTPTEIRNDPKVIEAYLGGV